MEIERIDIIGQNGNTAEHYRSDALRNRIKQLENRICLMLEKCKQFDEMKERLSVVTRLYEARCRQDGWTDEQLKSLQGAFINKHVEQPAIQDVEVKAAAFDKYIEAAGNSLDFGMKGCAIVLNAILAAEILKRKQKSADDQASDGVCDGAKLR